jgi:hypothetical protein
MGSTLNEPVTFSSAHLYDHQISAPSALELMNTILREKTIFIDG